MNESFNGPGYSFSEYEEPEICQVCLDTVDDCECPECKVCGEVGDPACLEAHDYRPEVNLLKDWDFVGVDTFYQLGRAIYKGTPCGPWIVAVLADGTEVYYESEEANKITKFTPIRMIKVGSIVEGSDCEATTIEVTHYQKLSEAIEEVNMDACAMWEEANEGWDDEDEDE